MNDKPVIAAVDGSQDGLRALEWALDAARRHEAPLRVLHVRPEPFRTRPDGPPGPGEDPVLAQAQARLAELGGVSSVEYVVTEGAPGPLLTGAGAEARLLVLGSRGRGGFASLLLGSNSLAAARDAECPVVVVPRPGRGGEEEAPVRPDGPVVVGVNPDGPVGSADPDSPDATTLASAFDEAARRNTALRVVTAYPSLLQTVMLPGEMPPPQIDQDALEQETRALLDGLLAPHRERHPHVVTDTAVLPGDAAGHLVDASEGAALVVVGRHRRRLFAAARMMGSVTQAVLLHSRSPVAVVPPVGAEDGAPAD
ncbi:MULTISPECIES: universal stress protein [Streptomyces]|uniref:Universal stress protein n=1 Tax=Streptomyces tendae TaxID=1932 RepID=A0ABX5ZU29_STRTE|nr:universal stress protein [Streptomyces tendae]QER88130.1 universal stress protein [Streptomyces tendae]